MDDLMLMHLHQAIDDVLRDDNCLVFRDGGLLVDFVLEVLAIAVFDHQDFEVLVAVDVVKLDEVGVVAHEHQSRLSLSQSFLDFLDFWVAVFLDDFEVDEFDCYLYFRFVVHAAVDLPVGA